MLEVDAAEHILQEGCVFIDCDGVEVVDIDIDDAELYRTGDAGNDMVVVIGEEARGVLTDFIVTGMEKY
jgi:hypothetical protein